MKKVKTNGFTLIELLVVLVIVSILATIVLVSLGSVRAKARDARRESDIRQMMLAMEMYYDSVLKYPEKGTLGTTVQPPTVIGVYLSPVPEDPGATPPACVGGYQWRGNTGASQQYCLWACLESGVFFAASPKGTRMLENAPTGLDCW